MFLVVLLHGVPAAAADFDEVAARAELQAKQPYRSTSVKPIPELQALTYDQYRDIRFRTDHALWRAENLPFELMFFHLGKFQAESVRINEITPQGTRHIRYRSADFDYGKNKLSPQTWGDIGFAGFRAHYSLNSGEYKDELLVFLGASYFRALGAGLRYGLSARGLAIDTVGGQGEEFPRFTEFWIAKPTAAATSLTIYALLDSPRASGAYQFDIRPGDETVMERARAYFPPRESRDAGHRAADQHVCFRREPAASHRLSSGGARLRWLDDCHRRWRMDLASVAQSLVTC